MSRHRKRSYSRHSRDYSDDRGGAHRDYHDGESYGHRSSRSPSRSRSRDRGSSGSVGGDWDWKRRPLRILSPHSPLRTRSPHRGRGRGYPSPRRGRGRGSAYSSSNPPDGPRFETQRVNFHDDQVREVLMSSDSKFLTEIKQKFPGVSSIDLAMKNGIAFSGSSAAVKVNNL